MPPSLDAPRTMQFAPVNQGRVERDSTAGRYLRGNTTWFLSVRLPSFSLFPSLMCQGRVVGCQAVTKQRQLDEVSLRVLDVDWNSGDSDAAGDAKVQMRCSSQEEKRGGRLRQTAIPRGKEEQVGCVRADKGGPGDSGTDGRG